MKIFVAGGSGFVGVFLSRYLVKRGHHVVAGGMRPRHVLEGSGGFTYVSADMTLPGSWQEHVKEADAVVNLAGRNIFRYWTDTTKRQIYDSRILTTRNLVVALRKKRQGILLNTSAVGYYGDRGNDILTEASPAGDDFLARVSVDWEKEALQAADEGSRVALLRFGVILGRDGGALAKMLPAFKFCAGGPLGSGGHWFSWMHIQDLADAVLMILLSEKMRGVFNCCSPNPEKNRIFAKALGKTLGRPALLTMPALVIKLIMGELGGVMLSSQRCVPQKLQAHGFEFRYPHLEAALENLVNQQ